MFDPEGVFLRSWGVKGKGDGEFDNPSGLLIIEDVVFVVDTMNHRIQKYDLDGTYIGAWGSEGSDKLQLKYPWGITTGNSEDIYMGSMCRDIRQRGKSIRA